MESDIRTDLVVRTLSDAFGVGLDLVDLFAVGGDYCAVWLGRSDGTMLDFVICTEERGRDVARLVDYAELGARLLGAERVVLWRSACDLTDGPRWSGEFFEHRDLFEGSGATLVDEILLGDDELRSLAITTFADEQGWDDVTAKLASFGDDGPPGGARSE